MTIADTPGDRALQMARDFTALGLRDLIAGHERTLDTLDALDATHGDAGMAARAEARVYYTAEIEVATQALAIRGMR